MNKMKPPPKLIVLLWHHFIFYKRHWFKLLITLLVPFLLYGVLHLFMQAMVDVQRNERCLESKGRYVPCSRPIESSFSDNLINRALYELDKEAKYTEFGTELGSQKLGPWKCRLICNPATTRALDRSSGLFSRLNKTKGNGLLQQYTNTIDIKRKIQKVFYTPNTTKTNTVMNELRSMLIEYQNILNKVQLPASLMQQPTLSVEGYRNLEEMSAASRNFSNRKFIRSLGDFSDLGVALQFDLSPANYKYSIIYNTGLGYLDYLGKGLHDYWLLQDMVEKAMIRTLTGKDSNTTLGLAFKETPTKCWKKVDRILYILFPIPIILFIVISFLPCPSNFLHQVLTEKELKLREYLYIVGVGSFTLKLSWILFYSVFLVPLSIALACILSFLLPGNIWNFTNPSVIAAIFLAYNICQLSFCCMLTSILNNKSHSTGLITFLHLLFAMTSIVQCLFIEFRDWKLFGARLASLYPVTPLTFAIKYITSWEQQWQAVATKNFFLSPVVTDDYGGVGEAFMWLIFDTFLYLTLAWYFEKIFPGEFGQKHPVYFPFMPSYWFPFKFQCHDHNEFKLDTILDVENVDDQAHVPGVVLDQLTKIYPGGKMAVNGLSVKFYNGEIAALLGQNGAGKSTTMNCLVGVTTLTSGQVFIHQMDIDRQMGSIRKIVGFVPQHDILYPSLSVQEHLQFFGWLKGMTKDQVDDQTSPMLTLLGMHHLKQVTTTQLSRGQKRKLSIITAYLGFPQVLIFDEPTSGIDPSSRRDIWELFLSHKRNTTTILSTHFMEEADILGDRVTIIHKGQLKCSGSPMYLKQKYGKGVVLTIARSDSSENRDKIIQYVTMIVEGIGGIGGGG